MITQEKFYGGSRTLSTSGGSLAAYGTRVHLIQMNIAGPQTLTLPDARRFMSIGWPSLVIANIGPNAFVLNDNAGGTLVASLAVNQWAILALISNATQAGTWSVNVRTRLT